LTIPFVSVDGDVRLNAGHAAGLMVRVNALSTVCTCVPQLSVARTVKLKVPAAVGIPDMKPAEFIFIPDGKEPAITVKVTGACPPVARICVVYPCPTVPPGSGDNVDKAREGQDAGFTVRINALSTDCGKSPRGQLSVALTVKENVPGTFGRPDMKPEEDRLIPGGSEPETRLKVIGDWPPDVWI
jgi:hypothetical protein